MKTLICLLFGHRLAQGHRAHRRYFYCTRCWRKWP